MSSESFENFDDQEKETDVNTEKFSNDSQVDAIQAIPVADVSAPIAEPIGSIISEIDQPNWLHPSSIVFESISSLRQHMLPVVIALIFGAAQGSFIWLGIAFFAFVVSTLVTIVKYLTLRYIVRDGELVVTEGFIFRRVRTVPVRRIQNMDLVQSLIHRIFKVAEVKIETASGSEAEATLRVLTLEQIKALRNEIFGKKQIAQNAAGQSRVGNTALGHPTNELQSEQFASESLPSGEAAFSVSDVATNQPRSHVQTPSQSILKIPTSWLVKAGLCSNRGLILVGVAIGALAQVEPWEYIDFNWINNNLPGFLKQAPRGQQTIVTIIAIAIAVLIFLRVFGVAWYILRFSGYQLSRFGEDLRISCGLFTKVSATVPRRRIQFISIHRPFFYRYFGLAAIKIETAGGAAIQSEDAAASVARSWFVPAIPYEKVNQVLSELRPGFSWDESQQIWQSPSKKTFARLSRFSLIGSILVTVTGTIINLTYGYIPGILLLLYSTYMAYRKSQSMRYARTDFGVAFRSGILYRKLSLTFFERFQTIKLEQSLFDRRWKMAKLSVDTAAAGPAGHKIHAEMLDEDFARSEFLELQKLAATHRPEWN